MSEQTGKAIEVQRQRVNELHLRRGEEVRLAREIREHGRAGETEPDMNAAWREDYDAQWKKVEELTEQINLAELELKALEREIPVNEIREWTACSAEAPATPREFTEARNALIAVIERMPENMRGDHYRDTANGLMGEWRVMVARKGKVARG